MAGIFAGSLILCSPLGRRRRFPGYPTEEGTARTIQAGSFQPENACLSPRFGLNGHVRCTAAIPSKPGSTIGIWDVALGQSTQADLSAPCHQDYRKLARIPAKWNRFADRDSRQINMLEQIPIAKVFNPGSGPGQAFGGICSMRCGKGLAARAYQSASAASILRLAKRSPASAALRWRCRSCFLISPSRCP